MNPFLGASSEKFHHKIRLKERLSAGNGDSTSRCLIENLVLKKKLKGLIYRHLSTYKIQGTAQTRLRTFATDIAKRT
jgi:hypothetical protein